MRETLISRTFDEWSKDGFKIKKGSKGKFFNGKFYFTEEQVEKRSVRWNNWDDDYEHEMEVLYGVDYFC